MEFRIAGTFIDSLARLTDQEQKLIKAIAFDIQKMVFKILKLESIIYG